MLAAEDRQVLVQEGPGGAGVEGAEAQGHEEEGDAFERRLAPEDRALVEHMLSCTVIGTREMVREGLDAFVARTGADELMVTGMIFDHQARLRSFERCAEAFR